jgi:hypothetical protein
VLIHVAFSSAASRQIKNARAFSDDDYADWNGNFHFGILFYAELSSFAMDTF